MVEAVSPSTVPLVDAEALTDGSIGLKVLVLGEPGVGKSSLISAFLSESPTTKPAEIPLPATKLMKMADESVVTLELYDTLRNANWDQLRDAHCKGAVGAFIVFDLSRRSSFANMHNWVNLVKDCALPDC